MKWAVVVFCLFWAIWLGLVWESDDDDSDKVAHSSRRVVDEKWRVLPGKEMLISDMVRYAAGLSDEELLQELEKEFKDWLEANGGGKRFDQPRLAIFLARELGKRNRESGLRHISEWLMSIGVELFGEGNDSRKREFQFVEMRIRLACFAGWVSVDPEEAIMCLVESRQNEEDEWLVVNQGFLMYIKSPEFFAMEEVLRDGFGELARSDFTRAKELFEAGTGVWAFDPNEVVGSLLAEIPGEDWSGFFDSVNEEVGRKFGEKDEDGAVDSWAARLRAGDWTNGYFEILTQGDGVGRSRNDTLWAMARDRPNEVVLSLKDNRVSEETKRWLFVGLVAADSRYLSLLGDLADAQKVDAIHAIACVWEFDFKLLTGREGFSSEDLADLISVVRETSMSEESRQRIDEILNAGGEERR